MNKYQEVLENLKNWVVEYVYDEDGLEISDTCLDDLYPSEFAILQELVDKETPKKVLNKHKEYVFPEAYRFSGRCPNCKNHVDENRYCNRCGQKLDWSDE